MIISLRGTNGSGKSTIAREFLKYRNKPKYGVLGARLPEAYEITLPKHDIPLYMLGPYLTAVGGMDVVQPYDLIPGLITKYAAKGNVLFEGLLVGKSKGSVGELLEQWGKEAIMVFLDTPMDVCIKMVEARRAERGKNDKPFNPRNLAIAYESCTRLRARLIKEGVSRVEDISRENAVKLIEDLLYGRR